MDTSLCANRRKRSSSLIPGACAVAVILCLLSPAGTARAQWTTVVTGIEYQQFAAAGPNDVFVVRMDRSQSTVTIDSMIAQGRLSGGRETVTGMVQRYHETIGYWDQVWGKRYQVVAAINGFYFDLNTGVPSDGFAKGGWYAKRYEEFGFGGFFWTVNREALMTHCMNHRPEKNSITFANQNTVSIDAINVPRLSGELVIYTHHYGSHTATDNTGVEVLVEMSRPALLLPEPSMAVGTVRAVHENQGSTFIPFDHVVLSATGSKATELRSNATVDATLGISQELTTYESGCGTPAEIDTTKTYAAIGHDFYFLTGGVVQTFTNPNANVRNPRTAVAYNNTHVFFVVVDGRTAISVGMTMTELGNFCRDDLGATEGAALDGGGSSTMWVDGQIKNNPSDGSERPVANGMMMVRVLNVDQSAVFQGYDTVRTVGPVGLRLGPGNNFSEFASVGSGDQGTVTPHTIAGVLATGNHWWKVRFANDEGWVNEGMLQWVASLPDGGLPPGDGGPGTDAAVGDGGPGDGGRAGDGGSQSGKTSGGCNCNAVQRGSTPGPTPGPAPLIILITLVLAIAGRRKE